MRIFGSEEDFTIEFMAAKRMRSSVIRGFITTMFSGGFFLRRSLRLQETFEKLENEFWAFVEETIIRLIGSAEGLDLLWLCANSQLANAMYVEIL